jgi:tetratricopeptide (TPR) repeat protein
VRVRRGRVFAGLTSALLATLGYATPLVPESDALVLERVPAAAELRQLQPLRERLAARPEDLVTALELARRYLEIGRAQSDPRFVSYAQASLAPWLAGRDPDSRVLILDAAALQFLHRFDESLTLLDRALARDPEDAQGWLIKAAVLQVQGRYAEGRLACRRLIRSSGPLIAVACLTAVDSLDGRLEQSYRSLRALYVDDARLPPGLRVFLLDDLADMAGRLGDRSAAENYLRSALHVIADDPYTQTALADLLLAEQRDPEVVALLRAEEAQDNALLRLAIAGAHLALPERARWADTFQARYEAAVRAGDVTHLREQARFLLEVRHEPRAALALARRNWDAQHEPADVRVLFAAACAAGDAAAQAQLRRFILQHHYQDHTLDLAVSHARCAAPS